MGRKISDSYRKINRIKIRMQIINKIKKEMRKVYLQIAVVKEHCLMINQKKMLFYPKKEYLLI